MRTDVHMSGKFNLRKLSISQGQAVEVRVPPAVRRQQCSARACFWILPSSDTAAAANTLTPRSDTTRSQRAARSASSASRSSMLCKHMRAGSARPACGCCAAPSRRATPPFAEIAARRAAMAAPVPPTIFFRAEAALDAMSISGRRSAAKRAGTAPGTAAMASARSMASASVTMLQAMSDRADAPA